MITQLILACTCSNFQIWLASDSIIILLAKYSDKDNVIRVLITTHIMHTLTHPYMCLCSVHAHAHARTHIHTHTVTDTHTDTQLNQLTRHHIAH